MVLPVQRASASLSPSATPPFPGFTAAAPRSAFTVQRNDAPGPGPLPARASTSAATSTSTSASASKKDKDKDEKAKEQGSEFDARKLSDGQLDELTHRLISPLTRLLRAELRLDRERIGRLRDPRR